MCFVDSCGQRLLRSGVFECVSFRGRRIPETGIVHGGDFQVLGDIFDPSWYSLDSLARGCDHGNLLGQQLKQLQTEACLP